MESKKRLLDRLAHRVRDALLFLSSTESLLICLVLAMILVVIGTVAQAEIGNFAAQQYFFNSFFLFAEGPFGVSLPVFPGGLSVGLLWGLSIIAAMCVRAAPGRGHIGLFITHFGILLLLLGQCFSQVFSQELRMFLEEGRRSNYAVNTHEVELASILAAPEDREETVALPFSLTLKSFSHEVYPGTDIPKNFSSLVHLSHPEQNEDRDVLIYMNHPLRYGGYAFYQASFGKNNTLSILQVVKNPAWLAPYVSCTLMLLGLAICFLGRLLHYLRRL